MAAPTSAGYRAVRRYPFDHTGVPLPQVLPSAVNYLAPGQPRESHHSFGHDGPGVLSSSGPRHDNDHVRIRDVQILPTMDEILATSRPPYMPLKDAGQPHFLPHGPARLLDTRFRYLRHDSTESIRDICYTASQMLVTSNRHGGQTGNQAETPSGNRFFIYHDVTVEEVLAHERKGMLTRVSYTCPKFMRGQNMYESARLKEGMLCALIGVQHNTGELSVTFFNVLLRQSTYSMESRGGSGTRAAVQLSLTQAATYDDLLLIARHIQGAADTMFALVEFPKVLFVGFYWCLRRLQEMREDDIAFTGYIAPYITPELVLQNIEMSHSHLRRLVTPLTPAYSQHQGFAFDLSCLVGRPASFTIDEVEGDNRDVFFSFLTAKTRLDRGQANAFIDNITREVAFTQGPPGTGKTYLGIALTRVLLASRNLQHRKPILVVCLTNHALDSFLAGLRDAGIDKLVRMGGGSKEEWTKGISLLERSKKLRPTLDQRKRKDMAAKVKEDLFTALDSWCKGLSSEKTTGDLSWHSVQRMLREDHADIHRQLVTAADNKCALGFVFEYWACGGDIKNLADLRRELRGRLLINGKDREGQEINEAQVDTMLLQVTRHIQRHSQQSGVDNVWNLDAAARTQLLHSWNPQVNWAQLTQDFAAIHLLYQAADQQLRDVYNAIDATTLLEQDVIGMTTTACAQRRDLLLSLDLEIMICEEAGQVMEPHTLCSLLPTLQHAIFIGDPLQLRPEVAEQSMSMETTVGKNYRLDESLFERFMIPSDPAAGIMPTSQLNVQRRMHPDIADITRLTYPRVTDHVSTTSHPMPPGLVNRMYWIDHRVPELDTSDVSKSHINAHEVAFVAGLVKYLLRGSEYSAGDIAVLTPYNGQLAALHESLSSTCQVWLNEEDREALLDEKLLPEQEMGRSGSKDEVQMSDLLRIATVDNFQGEEAKVIIMTTVRSGGRPGFLKTVNRINVACSRARDGFYIVGNAVTLNQVPRWRAIIDVFAEKCLIGSRLRTCCDRHPEHVFDVHSPDDFDQIPECMVACDAVLDCGHRCEEFCHSPNLHSIIPCGQPCKRLLACDEHQCPGRCFEKCGPCTQSLGLHTLHCGHEVERFCSKKTIRCQVVVDSVIFECGHLAHVRCFESQQTLVCKHRCDNPSLMLPVKRAVASSWNVGGTTVINSATQPLIVLRVVSCALRKPAPMDHAWQSARKLATHVFSPTLSSVIIKPPPRSSAACHRISCPAASHALKARWNQFDLPAAIVMLIINTVLPCGHACPGVCGENCLPESQCSVCDLEEHMDEPMVFVPSCQHYNAIRTLDRRFLSRVYLFKEDNHVREFNHTLADSELALPTCFCGHTLPSLRRYQVLAGLNQFTATMDTLAAQIGRTLDTAAATVARLDQELRNTSDSLVASFRSTPLAAKANKAKLMNRGQDLVREQKRLIEFRARVVDGFEESLRTLHGLFPRRIPAYLSTFSLRFSLLEYKAAASSIYDSLHLALKLFVLADRSQNIQRQARVLQQNAITHCLRYIDYCQKSIEKAAGSPCVEVELRIQQHYFHILADSAIFDIYGDESRLLQRLNHAIDGLSIAADLCKRYPNTAGSFTSLVRKLQNRSFRDTDPDSIRIVGRRTAQGVEHAWSCHIPGSMEVCNRNKHFYSKVSFPSGCPECGRRVEPMDEEYAEASKFLFEDAFLQAMKK